MPSSDTKDARLASSKVVIALLAHDSTCLRQLAKLHDCSGEQAKLDGTCQTAPASNRMDCNVTRPRY